MEQKFSFQPNPEEKDKTLLVKTFTCFYAIYSRVSYIKCVLRDPVTVPVQSRQGIDKEKERKRRQLRESVVI